LYSKSADKQLPLASLTKLVTALVADEVLGQRTRVVVSERAIETEGQSGLLAGDSWVERDLSDFMLTVSSNDAATVLATSGTTQRQFIAKMNQLVARLGLSSIVLLNESGLDVDEQNAGAYGSAKDIALLLTYITTVRPELLEATTFDRFTSVSLTGRRYKAVNTNKAAHAVPGLIGGKTGFTDIAGGNLAVVFDAGMGRHVAVVVLGSSKEGRFTDVLKLVAKVM
jgi:D-alanyl-D-alanine carboxypeptidase (penicillin-binding protein 5/6)